MFNFVKIVVGFAAFLLCAASSLSAFGEENWAAKMFEAKSHDFGTVARGAKVTYGFKFKNLYKEDLHIREVRSSCGCTSPRAAIDTVKSLETSEIIAELNTRSFIGQKQATITIVFDKPMYAEVQLNVAAKIRSDVVFHPGEIVFESVTQGSPSEKSIEVAYAGRNDWKIVDIRSANKHLEVELDETGRANGKVTYVMKVRLKEDAPAGHMLDEIIIVTDDKSMSEIPLAFSANVVGALTASPTLLDFGAVSGGNPVTKKILLKGKEPFTITKVECEDPSVKFEIPTESKALQFLPVTFTPSADSKLKSLIKIETSLGSLDIQVTGSQAVMPTTKTAGKPSDKK